MTVAPVTGIIRSNRARAAGDRLVVLSERGRERVGADDPVLVRASPENHLTFGRGQRCPQGRLTRSGDRRRRDAGRGVGVPRRLGVEIALEECFGERLAGGVVDGGVDLQRHALGETVVDRPGHEGSVDIDTSLAFDHRATTITS